MRSMDMKSTCIWCGQPIFYWEERPGGNSTWYHVRTYPEGFASAFGQHPDFCTELRAIPVTDES